jgi:SAM-dependent methyltransferase
MADDYERHTREHYQSDEVAQEYHEAFATRKGWKSLRPRLVASGERRIVRRFLGKVDHGRVLDIPAGTGKLAPIFKDAGSRVKSCDIAPSMLAIAKQEYERIGYDDVDFQVCDAERIAETVSERFDVAVCLRLLHRVPPAVQASILAGLASVADHVIVSFGVTSSYHNARRIVRRRVLGGDDRPIWFESLGEVLDGVRANFDVVDRASVLPFLSQEVMLLLRSRPGRG